MTSTPTTIETTHSQLGVLPVQRLLSGNITEGGREPTKMQDSDGTSIVGDASSDVSNIHLDGATGVLMSGNTGLDGNHRLRVQDGGLFDSASDAGFKPTC